MTKIAAIFKNIPALKQFFISHKFIFFPIVIFIMSTFLTTIVIIPNIRVLTDASKATEDLKAKNQFFENKNNILNEVNEKNFKDYINTSFGALPQDLEIPDAINQVLFLLSQNNLQLDAINFALSAQDGSVGGTQSFQIKLDVTGDILQIKNFIAGVKKVPRLMKVLSLDIIGGRSLGRAQATIVLAIYFQPLPQNISSVDARVERLSSNDLEILKQIKALSAQTPVSQTPPVDIPKGKQDPFN